MIKVDRKYGTVEAFCDKAGCGFSEMFDKGTFLMSMSVARKAGWDVKKISHGVWEHSCPACNGKVEDNG